MKEIKLSRRLQTIAEFVPNGKIIVDIGSDHGLLVSYLIKNEISLFAIAGEVNDGPFQATKKQINNFNLEDKVSVRKGNGFEIVEEKVDIVVIAGMGGVLITDILDKGSEKLNNVERLILQPNVGEADVRKWLDNNHWNIIGEEILKENGKIYEIIVAEPRANNFDPAYQFEFNSVFPRNKEDLYRIGPILLCKKGEILLEKWIKELKKIEYILKQLEKANKGNEKDIREEEIYLQYKWINEVIICLHQVNT